MRVSGEAEAGAVSGVVVTPMDRFAAIASDPNTMETVGQRVMGGETLRQIAVSWQIPAMRFVSWVIEDLARLQVYEGALRVRADELAHETIAIADNEGGDSRRDSLRVRTRLQMAGHWDRQRYGAVSRQEIAVTNRRHASELTDDELLAIIENARRDAAALEGKSSEVLAEARQLPAPVAGEGELI